MSDAEEMASQLATARAEIEFQKSQVASLRAAIAERDEQIRTLKAAVEWQRKTVDARREELNEYVRMDNIEKDQLRTALAEREHGAQIEREEMARTYNTALENKERAIAARDEKIEQLISASLATADTQDRTIAALKAEIAELKRK